jgi:hypothetical protein
MLYFLNVPFEGSVEANTLMPTLLAEDPWTRQKICDLDVSLCPASVNLAAALRSGEMSVGRVQESRFRGLAAIKEAVTSDHFPLSFSKAVHPVVAMYALDLAQGGSPRLVVAYSLPGQELVRAPAGAPGSTSYPVLLRLMASRESDGQRVELTTSHDLPMPHLLGKGEFLSGLAELPLPPGRWVVTVVFTQPDQRGALATLEPVVMPEWKLSLSLSDLVLGREDIGLRWSSGPGGQLVALNPLNSFPVGGAASVYAQVSGLVPGQAYHATLELFEGSKAEGKPALTLDLTEVATAARAELSRTLGLANLKVGRYLVRLTIESGGTRAMTTSGLEIVR